MFSSLRSAFYPLRTLPIVYFILRIYYLRLHAHLAGHRTLEVYETIDHLAAMDLYHALFYALIPGAAIIMFLPVGAFKNLRLRWRVVATIVVGCFTGSAPVLALKAARPEYILPAGFLFLCFLLGLNAALLVFFNGVQKKKKSAFWKTVSYGFIVSDVLVPVLVWLNYRWGRSRLYPLWRVIPATYFCLPLALIVFMSPPPISSTPLFSAKTRLISEFPNYYDLVAHDEGSFVWVSRYDSLSKINTLTGEESLPKRDPVFRSHGVNALALSSDGKHLTVASFGAKGYLLSKIDAKTLEVEKESSFAPIKSDFVGGSVMLTDDERGIVLAAFEEGIVRFSADMEAMTVFHPMSMTSFAVLDPKRRIAYLSFQMPGMLIALDVDTLRVLHYLLVPEGAQRLVLDPVRDRLFVSFPMESLVRVVDLDGFRMTEAIHTFFGVRTLHLDQERRLLFFGGFAPYMEVYNADDLVLLDRLRAPAWQRGIITTKDPFYAFITTSNALWQMDLHGLSKGGLSSFLHRIDPFFLLQRFNTSLLLRLHIIEMQSGTKKNVFYSKPIIIGP